MTHHSDFLLLLFLVISPSIVEFIPDICYSLVQEARANFLYFHKVSFSSCFLHFGSVLNHVIPHDFQLFSFFKSF